MTQFTARDLLQHEREKAIQAESVSKPTLCLLHINPFVLELCQCHCAGEMAQVCSSLTMRPVSDVFDRGSIVVHAGYLGLWVV